MNFVTIAALSLRLQISGASFDNIPSACQGCVVLVQNADRSEGFSTEVCDISPGTVSFSLAELTYAGALVDIAQKLQAGAVVILAKDGHEESRFDSVAVSNSFPQCGSTASLHIYRDKVRFTMPEECNLESTSSLRLILSDSRPIHQFEVEKFDTNTICTEKDNAAISGREFLEIVNDLLETKKMDIELNERLLKTFTVTVVAEEDLTPEKLTKYWIIIVIVVSIILLIVIVVLSTVFCKRAKQAKESKNVNRVSLNSNDELFGQCDRQMGLSSISNVSRHFGVNELLGNPLSARILHEKHIEETKVVNSPLVVGSPGSLIVIDDNK